MPLQIWIAHDAETFRAWTKRPEEAVGMFTPSLLGNIAIVAAQGEKKDGEVTSRNILFHTYTSYMLASHGARMPSWYQAGLAEYLGCAWHGDGRTESSLQQPGGTSELRTKRRVVRAAIDAPQA